MAGQKAWGTTGRIVESRECTVLIDKTVMPTTKKEPSRHWVLTGGIYGARKERDWSVVWTVALVLALLAAVLWFLS